METDAQHLVLLVMAVLIGFGILGAARFFHKQSRRVIQVADELAKTTRASEAHVDSQLEDIHMLVNSRLDEALDRIVLLEKRLKESREG